KELLEFARNNNPSGECAFILSPELNNQVNCVGKTSSLDFSSREAVNMLTYNRDLYVMHNHPKNSSFSTTDIIFLLQHDSVKTLSIVKHNGRIEQLTKSYKYSGANALNDFWQMLNAVDRNQSIDRINKEYDKIVKDFISKEWFTYEKT
ncbi:MAG: hypothetical protein K2O29_09540, partial [Ruminococcus sp.]|nr:hypothetical protein [Ruminococcus sp.]